MNLILIFLIIYSAFIPQVGGLDSHHTFSDRVAIASFRAASRLTDPICKSHELYRRIALVDTLYAGEDVLSLYARKISLCAEIIDSASLAAITTLPGVFLRALGTLFQTHPFIYIEGGAVERELPRDRPFSLFSWNICGVGGGYAISDGGVLPWPMRIEQIANKIIDIDADVNCLYETFDIESALYLSRHLQEAGYGHFYINMGSQAVGVSSGILVASKYRIHHPEFTRFPQDTLVGRTKSAAKGVFAFDLGSAEAPWVRIYATHLQHSENPQFPTREEVTARAEQMQIIVDQMSGVSARLQILTGDLNLDDEEYAASSWQHLFQTGRLLSSQEEKTWGGDAFCKHMMGDVASKALNLDHTMIFGTERDAVVVRARPEITSQSETARKLPWVDNRKAVHIRNMDRLTIVDPRDFGTVSDAEVIPGGALSETELISTGYEATSFQTEALSDHAGLLTRFFGS